MKFILLLGALFALQETREAWETRARELEAALRAAESTDTLHLNDGRKLTGKIDEETSDHVRIKVRLGSMKIPRADIARVERSPVQEFLTKLAAARGKAADLQALLEWAGKNGLSQGKELAACELLAIDPSHAAAKAALGATEGAMVDVLHLKDGTRKDGVIASETADAVVLDVPLRGPKGETMGLGKSTVPRSQIEKIDRMPEANRAKARERLAAFSDRSRILADALDRIRPTPTTLFEGRPGFRTESDVFILQTTCSEAIAKETTHALNQMFAAFQRHFSVRRNAGQKVRVYFFAARAEYDAFQKTTLGGVILNPAFFDPRANHIAAFNAVEAAKAEAIRKAIFEAEAEIEAYKKKVTAEEERVEKQARDIRAQVNEMAAEAKRQARGNPQAEIEINRQKKAILDDLKRQEKEINEQLAGYRKKMNEAIEKNRAVVRSNRAVLVNQNRAMYEMLFHETFHAFAANYLWTESDEGRLPHWLHEGMATYYERSVIEAGELIHGSVHPMMLDLARQSIVPLDKIVVAGGESFLVTHPNQADRSNAHYASAWGLAHFLVSRGTTKEQFEAYAKASRSGDARKAFEVLAGKPLSQLEPEWRAYIALLK